MRLRYKKTIDAFENNEKIAEIKDLKLSYRTKKGPKLIISNASLKIRKEEILGIIGESGSGKTVLTSTLTGLNSDIQIVNSGKIIFEGQDISHFTPEDWRREGLRGKKVSQVFQNPLSSLNPYVKIGKQIIESILINSPKEELTKSEAKGIAIELLDSVMIQNAPEVMNMYPHQLSGGMNQRIVIVIILAAKPDLIIFDEPTTALDPVAQAQIIEIIRTVRRKHKVGIIIISHDIALISSIADTMMIMYAGSIVEVGKTKELLSMPLHPYTWGLMRSIPDSKTNKKLYTIPGQVPVDISKNKGDVFAERSDYALEIDFELKPPVYSKTTTHHVWSWLYDKNAPTFKPPVEIQKLWNKSNKKRKTYGKK